MSALDQTTYDMERVIFLFVKYGWQQPKPTVEFWMEREKMDSDILDVLLQDGWLYYDEPSQVYSLLFEPE